MSRTVTMPIEEYEEIKESERKMGDFYRDCKDLIEGNSVKVYIQRDLKVNSIGNPYNILNQYSFPKVIVNCKGDNSVNEQLKETVEEIESYYIDWQESKRQELDNLRESQEREFESRMKDCEDLIKEIEGHWLTKLIGRFL